MPLAPPVTTTLRPSRPFIGILRTQCATLANDGHAAQESGIVLLRIDRTPGGYMRATGKCLCGAVTFTAQDVEPEAHVCHCSMCRHWAGGPTFSVACSSVEFRGLENVRRFRSSEWAERGFCERCGSNLFYRLLKPDQYLL